MTVAILKPNLPYKERKAHFSLGRMFATSLRSMSDANTHCSLERQQTSMQLFTLYLSGPANISRKP